MGWHSPDNVSQRRARLGVLFGFLPAMVAFVIVLGVLWRLDFERREQMEAGERAAVEARLDEVGGHIAAAVNGDIKLGRGLVSVVSVEPDMNQDKFSALVGGLFDEDTNLRSIAAAPDLVVTLTYPLEENRRAIGLDYRTHPEQREAALRTVAERRTLVTGPVDLVQGGKGLIIRYPVLRQDDGAPWGILSAILDVDKLYAKTGLLALTKEFDVTLEKNEEDRAGKPVFSTGETAGRDPVRVTIDLGYVNWTLSAVPKTGWGRLSNELILSRLEGVGVATFILLPLVWAGVLLNQRQRRTEALEEREAEVSRLSHRLEMALSTSAIGVWELDVADQGLFWDQRMRELFSVSEDRSRFTYEDWRRAVHPEDVLHSEATLRETIETGKPFGLQFRIVGPNGAVRHIRAKGTRYQRGGVTRIIGVNWDVSEDVLLNQALKEAKAQTEAQNEELRAARHSLEYLSVHDALTGLPNRRYLDRHLAARDGTTTPLAVLHVDLDRFKEINDTLGHAVGDGLLVEVGRRLAATLTTGDFAARVGGDEFVIVVDSEDPAIRARALAGDIIAAMGRPFEIEGAQCRIGCSIGLALRLGAGERIRDMLVNADIALYEAKKRGRNRVEVFTERLRLAAVHLKELSDELVTAVEQDQFVPFFQPQFEAHTLKIAGVEVLARWNHPALGILPPGAFLPVANDLNLVGRIDAIMLEKGLAHLADWRVRGLAVPRLSVNVSLARLQDENLFRSLSALSYEPGTLSFELLESISFDDVDEDVKAVLARLKAAHIGLEIDDFGTGHASIVNLLELGPDRLKIDRKLVASVEASGARRTLVAAIIEMGRALGIGTVAEGVETMLQAKILGDLGCDVLQGYALARPMSAPDFFRFASERENGSSKTSVAG